MKDAESIQKEYFRQGYQAARRDSLSHIKEAYEIGKAAGALEQSMRFHEEINKHGEKSDRDSRDSERDRQENVEVERTESADDSEESGGAKWNLHGFSKIRPPRIWHDTIVEIADEFGNESICLAKFIDWTEVKYYRILSESSESSNQDETEDDRLVPRKG